jgi:hypothetical protein
MWPTFTRYPFGEHGYHRPSAQNKKTHDTLTDPFKVIPDDKSDPLGYWTPPPEDPAAELARQEEARKAALRQRIDRLYGIGTPTTSTRRTVSDQLDELGNPIITDEQITVPDAEADAAKASMEAENTKLADATRQYYADQLGRTYDKAERQTRFKLARQGLLGGSEEVSQQGEVKQDRDLGATRVDEAVGRAVSTFNTQREQERLNAINLVNAGAGDSAVSAAQAGLRNSLENVSSQQKADIFSDLFTSGADSIAANNLANQQALLASRYRDRLSSFFNNSGKSTSGRVTPSS